MKKSLKKNEKNKSSDILVKFGKPVFEVTFKKLKLFVTIFTIIFSINFLLSLNLLYVAVKIRTNFGSILNLIISKNNRHEGDILPCLLALPIFLFFSINFSISILIYKIFSKKKSPGVNNLLFILILLALILIIATFVVILITLGHVYSINNTKQIEEGILKVMEKYAENSFYKKKIDKLQIEFQCCGSKKYQDWYNISWLDKALSTNKSTTQSGKTPFSCCAIKSHFPCIHFNIDNSGTNYYYQPEKNLSISNTGCYERIIEKKRKIGTKIVLDLTIFLILECILLVPSRFLQTAHSLDQKFEGNRKLYLTWLIGMYSGKNQSNNAPDLPPIPEELKD